MKPAAQLAALVLDAFRVVGKPDLRALCEQMGLRIREVDAEGFEGALVRSKNAQKGIVALRSDVREESRKRFTVAHEIGHFVIPYHRELGNVCASRSVERFDTKMPRPELEANEFAAELLLPTAAVRNSFNLHDPSLANIGAVATAFGTSLTATVYRFLELSDLPCTMVWSAGRKAHWDHRAAGFPFSLPIDALPTADSVAGRLFRGESVAGGMHEVAPNMWLDRRDAEKVAVLLEDSRYLPSYDAVLTLLWVAELRAGALSSDDEEGLADLDPEDFTLRRKRWPR